MKNLKFTLKAWPVIALATIGLNCLTGWIAKWMGWPLPDQAQMLLVKSQIGLTKQFLMICLDVIVLMPILEELLFRFPTRWVRRSNMYLTGVVFAISAALFSFAHYIDYAMLMKHHIFALNPLNVAFIALFFFGVAQCWLYKKTNIWCAMLNHGLFNATNLILIIILPESWQV